VGIASGVLVATAWCGHRDVCQWSVVQWRPAQTATRASECSADRGTPHYSNPTDWIVRAMQACGCFTARAMQASCSKTTTRAIVTKNSVRLWLLKKNSFSVFDGTLAAMSQIWHRLQEDCSRPCGPTVANDRSPIVTIRDVQTSGRLELRPDRGLRKTENRFGFGFKNRTVQNLTSVQSVSDWNCV